MAIMLRPRTFIDIKGYRGTDSFSPRTGRINLSFSRPRLSLTKSVKSSIAISSALLSILFGGQVLAPIVAPDIMAQTAAVATAEERAALEAELQAYEKQISEYEKTITEYNKKGSTLKGEINILNTKVNKLNLQIKAVNFSIAKLDGEIKKTSDKISVMQTNIDSKKEILTKTIRNLYVSDKEEYLEILLQNPKLSDFFSNVNNLTLLQSNVRGILEELVASHVELMEQKEQLSLQRSDKAAAKAAQDAQKALITSTKLQKDTLLKVTKGKESEYQKYLVDTKKKASEIRSRIFQFLGGGELTFETAYEMARLAENSTGVRAAFILAVLDRESALGKNVGRCDYKTAMHPTRDIPKFLEIIAELGLQKDVASGIIKVSCANSDGAYGGAMGPAQFIPSTWAMYKARIANASGSNPPSPWKNSNAIVATALYMQDLLFSCNYVGLAKERCAAAKYYSGSRWQNHIWGYGAKVVNTAERFQDDIDLLNS